MKRILLAAIFAFGVVSCGGEGPGLAGGRDGGGGTGGGGGGGGTDQPPVALSDLELLASTSQVQSDGSTIVTLTAIAKNENNQVVANAPVVFSASGGTLFVNEATTNERGMATAELTTGGDPTNRQITVTAAASGLEDVVDLSVIGSSLNIQGPSSLVNDTEGEYTITLSDSAGMGVAGRPIEISSENGNELNASTMDTDGNGRITVIMTGNSPGTDTLRATALPDDEGNPTVTASTRVKVSPDNFQFISPSANKEVTVGGTPETVTVRWEKNGVPQESEQIRFATTRGEFVSSAAAAATVVTDAAGEATVDISSETAGFATITATAISEGTTIQRSVEFIATNPANVELQADPATIPVNETTTITATVRDAENNLVKNATVEFTVNDNTNGSLSTPSAVTDSQGRAQTVYTASSTPSADGGVVVTGTVVGGAAPSDSTNITVSGRALFINFGTGNTIEQNDSDTHYIKDYVVMVTDSSGAGVANQTVNISVLSNTYLKGYMAGSPPTRVVEAICQNEDLEPFNGILDPGEDQNLSEYPEDTNNNGVLDAGEDVNENGLMDRDAGWGKLEPGNRALVDPGTVTTDESGLAEFRLVYPQDHAFWLNVTLSARATVSGTESSRSQRVLLPMSADDADNPPNAFSPFGTDYYSQLNCTNEDPTTFYYDPDKIVTDPGT